MIITVDPSQSEDIAAFAMVKQYRMQALNVTLNGGTGSSAWQAVQGGEGYTQTVVTPVTGIELVYEDPNAIVSYTVENDDTSNYDAASNAGIILSSIEPTDNAWTYTCVFHADSVPVSSVDIDLLVYGNIARGTEQQGSPATAEEITAQVLAGLETRVLALETEMPTKADDTAVVHKTGDETIEGLKTFHGPNYSAIAIKTDRLGAQQNIGGLQFIDGNGNTKSYLTGSMNGRIVFDLQNADVKAVQSPYQRAYDPENIYDVVTIKTLNQYDLMVRTANAQTIAGVKTFTDGPVVGMSASPYFVFRRTNYAYSEISSDLQVGELRFQDKTPTTLGKVQTAIYKSGTTYRTQVMVAALNVSSNTWAEAKVHATSDGSAFMTAPTRGYNAGSAYSDDVATIGTLDAYTPMVRTTGNQSIQGIKAFNSYIGRINPAYITDIQSDTYKYYSLYSLSTAIGATGPLIHYYATGGGNQATKSHKNVGWDLKGKGSNGKIYNGRFVITLDPDNERVFLGLRIQNETDGTTKSSTIATLNLTS